jgi:UDP-glucose 4-epimerase
MYESLRGARILVTGGAGFIGSHLVDRLLELGAGKVVVLDDLSTGKRDNIAHLAGHPNFTFHHGDANHRATLETIFLVHQPEFVFHLAAFVGVKRVEEQPLEVLKDLDGLRAIFDLSHKRGVRKVLFTSSSEAYGEPVALPSMEHGPLNANPRDPYALVKLIGENLCHQYWQHHKMPTVALRFFNVYGPRQEGSGYGFVVGIFLERALRGEAPQIFGDGSATRDFVFYRDNIECIVRAMVKDETNGETINVGKGQPTTILELARHVAALSGKDLQPVFLPPRKIEIKYRSPDVSKMEKLLGCRATTPLEEGLRVTYDHLLERTRVACPA